MSVGICSFHGNKIMTFWVMTPSCFARGYQHFRGKYWCHVHEDTAVCLVWCHNPHHIVCLDIVEMSVEMFLLLRGIFDNF